ncbi:hypothetical protein D3C80_1813960 [compost metagenome]
MKRPSIMPSVSVSRITEASRPANDMPALAKPKIGTMMKATGLASACSSTCSGEVMSSGLPGAAFSGIISAVTTPATVA